MELFSLHVCRTSPCFRLPLYLCKPSAGRLALPCLSLSSPFKGSILARCQTRNASEQESRSSILRRVDSHLATGNEMQALSLLNSAQICGFGKAAQVPQRLYSLADLRLNNIETSEFLSPVDATLGGVRRNLQIAAILGGVVAWQALQLSQVQVLSTFVALLLLSGVDLVVNNGGVEALLVDTIGRIVSDKYKNRVAQHEAGHFLVAYLLGILPKSYTLSSLDAYRKEGSLSVQAGTTFVDTEFQEEVKSGRLSSESLNKFSCIALAGVATEYILLGISEGGLADIQQLDRLMRSLNFTQAKADSQVRWAVLNIVTILRRHKTIVLKLASAMLSNKSVGECIDLIEEELSQAAEV